MVRPTLVGPSFSRISAASIVRGGIKFFIPKTTDPFSKTVLPCRLFSGRNQGGFEKYQRRRMFPGTLNAIRERSVNDDARMIDLSWELALSTHRGSSTPPRPSRS